MDFWLNNIIRRSRIPYPIFFGVISLLLYLLGIPLMITIGNLHSFLSEQRWVFLTINGIVSGISIIYVFRRYQDSLSDIRRLIGSEDEFQKINDILGYLTNKVYWIFVAFWPAMNIGSLITPTSQMNWWWYYNQPFLVTIYYYVVGIPTWIFGGIFFYMIPFGLTLAYRDLCLKTSFKEDVLAVEWMEPFKRFKSLITLTLLLAVVNSLFALIIWAPSLEQTSAIYVPYASIAITLVPTIIFPHYFFHKLFSRAKKTRLKGFQREISKITTKQEKDKTSKILLLLEKGEVEKLKTWLFDVKILGEVIVVALMHVILIEVLTSLMHG